MFDGQRRVVLDITRRNVKRREDFSEIEGRLLADGEKFPDLEKQNAATPKEEWFKTAYSNGQLKGPWDNVHEALPRHATT